ncbi:hypothetical protein [Pseudomonas chlororaphis]|nr:hypothetical protein [Pseudomonas chlororaphis]
MNTTAIMRADSPATLPFQVFHGGVANQGSTPPISLTLARHP